METERRSLLRDKPSGGKERKVGGGGRRRLRRRRRVHAAAYEIRIGAESGWRTKQEPHD